MKSAIAFGVSVATMISLQGCGGGDTTSSAPSPATSSPATSSPTPVSPTGTPASPTSTTAPCSASSETYQCPTSLTADFVDMHDGDSKSVVLADGKMTISQADVWSTELTLDPTTCRGSVDFNVSGKPNPPGQNLTLALLTSFAAETECSSPSNYVLSFSNETDETYLPLNQWVQSVPGSPLTGTSFKCFPDDQLARNAFFSDMKDGDRKVVAIDCGSSDSGSCSLTITPAGEGTWSISSSVDKGNCSGLIDFSGKDPSAGTLQATFRVSRFHDQPISVSAGEEPLEYFIEFVDPASPATQVNQWVEVGGPSQVAAEEPSVITA